MKEYPAADPAGREAIIARLTAAGAPFALTEAVINGTAMPVYRNVPPSLIAMIDAARAHGSATFLVAGERRLSYADVFAQADALTAWLIDEADVQPGQPVAIAMRNGIEWVVSFIAIVRTGAIAVLVNSRGAPTELRAALEDVNATFVMADERRANDLRASGWGGRIMSGGAWQAAVQSQAGAPPAQAVAPGDSACILFTSGTTGRAKGAVLSHRALIHGVMNGQMAGAIQMQRIVNLFGVAAVPPPEKRPQMAGLMVTPLFHIGGVGAGLLAHMAAGGKLVFMARWSADEALRLVGEERLTALAGVPTMLWDLLRSPQLASSDISSVAAVSTGGQGLALNLLDGIRQAFPRALIGSGWGMTETCGAVSVAMGDDYLAKPTSAGFVLPTWRVRVLDDAGEPLPKGAIGELVVQGVSAMRGYCGLSEATAEAMPNGWLRTGDLGRIDEDGYLFIVDRKKDMVISGGENIYCAEVENAIAQLPEAIDVTSFGVPDARLGERLIAAIATAAGATLTAEDVRIHLAAQLAEYKIPVEVILTCEPLPRNAVGKIEKRTIRQAYLVANNIDDR